MEMIFHSYASLLRRGFFVLLGGWGEKKKRQRAGNNGKGEERKEAFSRLSPLPIVPRALSIFSIIAIFIGIPSRNLCGGES